MKTYKVIRLTTDASYTSEFHGSITEDTQIAMELNKHVAEGYVLENLIVNRLNKFNSDYSKRILDATLGDLSIEQQFIQTTLIFSRNETARLLYEKTKEN